MIHTIYTFYRDGFRKMQVGKKLWAIIFIKLFIMFAVLKAFFFPDFLNTRFSTDHERAGHVLGNFIQSKKMGGSND
ncbi:MAG: DUF4492 domain-containing protein [Proteobacteria bacterium]|nr:DUF4492 domain-containing protein [Pseudomonadota bacterium]MBU1639812.1 DUF4492 domain-containing protein [Pseudomonadota bacterium]